MLDGYDTPGDYYDQKTPQARNFEDERYQKKIPNRNFEYMDTKIPERNYGDYEQKSPGRDFEQMGTKIPERTFQQFQPKLQQQHSKTSGPTEDEEKEENFWEKNGDVKFDSGFDNHVANQFPENNFDSINNLEKVLDREITINKEPHTRANEAFPREEENIFGKINQFSEKVIGNGNSLNAKAAQLGEYFNRESEMFNHKKSPIHAEVPNFSQSTNFPQHPNYLQQMNHFIQKPQTPLLSKPHQTFQEGVIRGGRLDNMRTGAIRGGRFNDLPTGLTSKGPNFVSNDANIGLSGHKNVKDIQNMVMESTTLYGMSGGFPTQGDIPSVRNAALLPSNLEMTAIDPKVLDMQQLAVEKRINVQTVNGTHPLNIIKNNQSLRTLEKTAMAKTGNVKSARIIIMAEKDLNKSVKPKTEEQAIQRTNLRKDLKKHLIKPDLTPSVPLIKNRLNKINIFKTKAKKQTVIIFPK